MTRRLRIAGIAFGALLVPACAGFQPDATDMRPVAPPTSTGFKPLPGPVLGQSQAAKARTVEKFAEGRTDVAPVVAEKATRAPTPIAAPSPAPAPVPQLEPTRFETPVDPPIPGTRPRLVAPNFESTNPVPEPTPDADGVIRSPLPVIKGVTGPAADSPSPFGDEPRLKFPSPVEPLLPVDRAPALAPVDPPAAIVAPSTLPPGVIGSSIHKTNASPALGIATVEATASVDLPALPTVAEKPSPLASVPPVVSDTELLRAIRAFQANKPDEAVECLKSYDPATQQIMLSLLPALARLSDGKLQQMKPEEMDVLLEQLTRVPNMLRPRASLQASNVRLCREVHNFAHTEAFPERHEFRPGDIVYLYMELANFSCTADPKGGNTVTLASSLELKDAAGMVVWRADPKEIPDKVSTPPKDYYRNFRLSIPNIPAGTYTLTVKTTDRPTGRDVLKTVEVRVGAR